MKQKKLAFAAAALLFLIFLADYGHSDSYGSAISSNSFGVVWIDSNTTVLIPSTATAGIGGMTNTVIFSTNSMKEINYSNTSSSSTVYFSTSPVLRWTLDNGFPIFAQQQISLPVDPAFYFSTNTATRFFFVREESTAGVGFIPIRTWVRNTLAREPQ